MSLLLWEYFWTAADWLPAPPAAPPPVISDAGARGGDYRPLPDKFWEEFRKQHTAKAPPPLFDALAEGEVSPIKVSVEQKLLNALRIEIQTIAELQAQIATLSQIQQILPAKFAQASSVPEMKLISGRMKEVETHLPTLQAALQSHIMTATRLREQLRS